MFFNRLKNDKGLPDTSEIFWGLIDKQNKLLLTANHMA